jgi:hypothetical protein
MSIFSSIKNAIFGHPAAAQTAPAADATAAPAAAAPATTTETAQQPVDVEAVLNQVSADKGNPAAPR